MNKLELLNSKLMEARKAGSEGTVAKNLLVTMKGMFENKSKENGTKVSDDIVIERIAKGLIKSANETGTEDAMAEIVILNEFVPQMLSEVEIRRIVSNVISETPGKPFGFYMGSLMKNRRIDGKVAKEILNELITSQQSKFLATELKT